MMLPGGHKHDHVHVRVTHGSPNLRHPVGTHGTMQMSLTDDAMLIQQTVKDFFQSHVRPGINLNGDVHFSTVDNGDGTMAVDFEVKM